MMGTVMKDKDRILVVDDEPGFLQVVKSILRAKGYEVETAPSAGEAIARARECSCNVAILDISLPDIEGTELLSILLAPQVLIGLRSILLESLG